MAVIMILALGCIAKVCQVGTLQRSLVEMTRDLWNGIMQGIMSALADEITRRLEYTCI